MINRILYRAGAFLLGIWHAVRALFIRLGWLKGSVLVVALLLIVGFGLSWLRGSTVSSEVSDTTRSVSVDSVSNLSQGGSALSVAGTVESQTEATVRAEKSGEVTAVYHALGDTVAAGTIVAELEDSSERAAVLQAQGAVQAATAGAQTSQTTLAAAQSGAVNVLLAAYSSADKVVHGDIDSMFSNPGSSQPVFNVQSANSQAKIDTESKRSTLNPILVREQARSSSLSTSDDLQAELTKTENDLRAVRDFLDSVIATLNSGIAANGTTQSTINGYLATANTDRSAIISTLSSVVSARQSLQTATQNSANGSSSSAAQASLTQAQGTLAAARAALEKSIIRAPISGTINSLNLKRGDFVQMTSPVLTVANNHALEVIAYITPNDAPRIAVGDKATLDTTTAGTITRIAPAIDPLTKKIEIRIGITGNSTLINGQSVSVTFASSTRPAPTGPVTRLSIPLTALKIGANDMSVFTVTASSTLEAHAVTIGELLGDRVVVLTGVTPDMMIVTDARGLRAGQIVTVK